MDIIKCMSGIISFRDKCRYIETKKMRIVQNRSHQTQVIRFIIHCFTAFSIKCADIGECGNSGKPNIIPFHLFKIIFIWPFESYRLCRIARWQLSPATFTSDFFSPYLHIHSKYLLLDIHFRELLWQSIQ